MMTKDIDPAEIGKQAHYIQSKYFLFTKRQLEEFFLMILSNNVAWFRFIVVSAEVTAARKFLLLFFKPPKILFDFPSHCLFEDIKFQFLRVNFTKIPKSSCKINGSQKGDVVKILFRTESKRKDHYLNGRNGL